MRKRNIYVTKADADKIKELLVTDANRSQRADFNELTAEIGRAKIVEPGHVPATVVTMDSKVLLKDMDTEEMMEFTLTFPNNADIESGKISILSPIGTAIFGYAAGDKIVWKVPDGKRHIKIEKILYQPEAAGVHDS